MACDPNVLIEQAKCIEACIPQGMLPAVQVSLLCQLTGSGVPGPIGPAGAAGAVGADGRNAGKIFYLDSASAADVAGYKQATVSPSGAAETTLVQVCTGTSDFLVEEFITYPTAGIMADALPAGTAFRHLHASTGLSTQVMRLKVELYTSVSPHGAANETLRRTNYSSNFSGASISELIWNFTDANNYAMVNSERIVFKVYAARVSGPATATATLYFNGVANASYIQTTISAGAVGATGPAGPTGAIDRFIVNSAGTVYTMTTAEALLAFGTTSPSITITSPGTWLIVGRAVVNGQGASFTSYPTARILLQRTNNTPGSISGSGMNHAARTASTSNETIGYLETPPIIYTTANSNDVVAVWGNFNPAPTAGSVVVVSASISALRLS